MIQLGLERLLSSPPVSLRGRRLGLLCNQASVDACFVHSRQRIAAAFPGQLSCLLTPQHGFHGDKQDNMIESGHGADPLLGIPVFSLYGETRRPTAAMLDTCDVLLVDLPDVGTRVYTFMSTLAYCLEEAAQRGMPVLLLDRPNPLGGELIEGNLLQPKWRSFVGLFPMPMRHGLTFGELGLFMNERLPKAADLTVIPMAGWRRGMLFPDTGLPWVFPSPNLPSFLSALAYPGQVIWEGTNVSEGRGTTLPFELFGAPFVEHEALLAALDPAALAGCRLRPLVFEPTSNKWAGQACRGFHIHVLDASAFRPYRLGLALLQAIARLWPEAFRLKSPPYEYEYELAPLDLILGDGDVRERLLAGEPLPELEASWQRDLDAFAEARKGALLY